MPPESAIEQVSGPEYDAALGVAVSPLIEAIDRAKLILLCKQGEEPED